MSLLDLPSEMIEAIVGYLDSNSLLALRATYPELQDLTGPLLEFLKLEAIRECDVDNLSEAGCYVRKLDLSALDPSFDTALFYSVIEKCDRITELNLFNVTIWENLWPYLLGLEHLRTFHMTAPVSNFLNKYGPLRSVRELYIEVRVLSSRGFILDLISESVALEAVHIFFPRPDGAGFAHMERLPDVVVERWRTLRKVECSTRCSVQLPYLRGLLRHIFANHPDPEAERWIRQQFATYMYEDGDFTGDLWPP